MKQEHWRSEEYIGLANKKRRVISLSETAPAAMVDLKEEDVVVEERDMNGVELSFITKEAHKVLKTGMISLSLL